MEVDERWCSFSKGWFPASSCSFSGGLDELQLLDQPPNGCPDKSFVGRTLPPYSPQKSTWNPIKIKITQLRNETWSSKPPLFGGTQPLIFQGVKPFGSRNFVAVEKVSSSNRRHVVFGRAKAAQKADMEAREKARRWWISPLESTL